MKKMDVMRRFQWCLSLIIFVGILMVNRRGRTGAIKPDRQICLVGRCGWVNFHSTYGSVTVYSTHLEGYAWAENIGWIRLGGSARRPLTITILPVTGASTGIRRGYRVRVE